MYNLKKVFNYNVFFHVGLLFVCILLYDNILLDITYCLINTGKAIFSHGFLYKDIYTFHENLNIVEMRWLSASIIFLFYDKIGSFGLYILGIAIYFLTCSIIYRTSLNLSENKRISMCITLLACIYLKEYMVLKPYLFTLVIFALENYLLEQYLKYKKIIFIIWIPILSAILINMHAIVWWMFIFIQVMYFLCGFKFSFFIKINSEGYVKKWLLIALLCSIIIGIINPYGINMYLCFIKMIESYSIISASPQITSFDFKFFPGIYIFIFLLFMAAAYIFFKGKTRFRYSLISIIMLYLALSISSCFPFFVICALPYLAFYMKSFEIPDFKGVKRKTILTVIVLCTIITAVVPLATYEKKTENNNKASNVAYFINNKLNTSKIRMYNNHEIGGYLEFENIKTFIDQRYDVFLKINNQKEDILDDYKKLNEGEIYYKDFINKYLITHLLITRNSLLKIYLMNDIDYSKIYEDDNYLLYKKN